MICFQEIVLIHFGKFENWSKKLDENAILFFGRNEAGKSTIQLFFKVMLYGVSGGKKNTRGIKERERMIPWNERFAEGILRLRINEKHLEIYRRFGKTAAGDRLEVRDAVTGEAVADFEGRSPGEALLHMPEAVFEKTFWLRQSGAFMGGADEEISTRLFNLLDTGEEAYSAENIFAYFEQEKKAIRAKDKRSHPGRLDDLWQKRDTLLRERYQLTTAMRQREEEDSRLNDLKKRQAETKEQLVRYQEIQKKKQWLQQIEIRQKKWQQAKQVSELANQALSREGYQTFKPLCEEEVDRAENLEKKLETLDRKERIEYDKEQAEHKAAELHTKEQKMGLLMPLGVVELAIAIFCATSRCAFWLPLTVLFSLCGLGFAGLGLVLSKKIKTEIEGQKAHIREIEQRIEQETAEREETVKQLHEIFEPYHVQNAASLREGYRLSRQAEAEAESYRRTYASLLEGEDPEALRLEEAEAEAELQENAEILECNAEENVSALQESLLDLTSQIKGLESKLSYVYQSRRSPADVETELAETEEKIQEEEKRYRAVCLAEEVFERVYQKRKTDFTPMINERVNTLMDALTDGRYRDIQVSEEYRMRVKSQDGAGFAAEYVSDGTYEQLYFALRLAIGDLIGTGEEPLFLDDFLTLYDDQRAKRAFSILQTYAKTRQILVFSCHMRDRETAAATNMKIIQLEEE